jgi:hypothetical protein
VLSVCVPWIVLASFMLTEVVALPAFLWAVLAIHRAVVRPSPRADLLALAAIALAVFARTQFVVLAGVLPLAILAYARARGNLRSAVTAHRWLAALYAAGAIAVVAVKLAGGTVLSLSIYGEQFGRGLVPAGMPGWALGHVADLAFGIGLLPFVVGAGWLLANVVRRAPTEEQQAFACVGAAAVLLMLYVVTTFDLQLGGYLFDRYLFYVVPIVLLAFICALLDARRPRWSLVLPVAAVVLGFVLHLQGSFTWDGNRVNSDSPIGVLYKPVVDAVGGHRGAATAALAAATIVLAALFVAGSIWLPHRRLAAVLLVLVGLALPAETGYTFHRLLAVDGESGRPLTQANGGVLDWVDRTVGTDAEVTIAPYPVSSAFLVTQRYWRDIEFWNKSIAKHVVYPNVDYYKFTGYWFPKTVLRFDEGSGAAAGPTARYALQSVGETRFRIAGTVIQQTQEAMLIDAPRPWRLAWSTAGLTEDGWTLPDTAARIRLYPAAGQTRALQRYLTLQVRAPEDVAERGFSVVSNLEDRQESAAGDRTTLVANVLVCVPAEGHADVTVATPDTSEIVGGQQTLADSLVPRRGGVLVAGLSVAEETAGACTP